MKFKLDENFGNRTKKMFADAGHSAESVRDEHLEGIADNKLFEVCCAERRCLVTLDLDFSDVTRFPPAGSNGIVVFRGPQNPTLQLLQSLVRQFLMSVSEEKLTGNLWIVEPGRTRIHQKAE